MTSILTNNGAMAALQTLKSINRDLGTVQGQISSGKKVENAKDNAAVWAISKVMESDVVGFKKISEGLAVGESTVAVARNAAETTTKLLTQMKDKIVQANDPAQANNLAKINADVSGLRDQIGSVVKAAQFNGVNLVNGATGINVLASLDRTNTGVTASTIAVGAQNLSTGGYTALAAFTAGAGVSTNRDAAAFTINAGAPASLVLEDAAYAAGDSISVRIGDRTVSHTFSPSDIAATSSHAAAVTGLRTQIEALGIPGLTVGYDVAAPGTLTINNGGTTDLSVSAQYKNANAGGLGALAGIDVTTPTGAAGALATVEAALQVSINAAAAFGTAQNRIETQSDFVGKLSASLTTGIGSMVDADMEEASARLQALQVQQQLGVQSLSIANQSPQSILSLFR